MYIFYVICILMFLALGVVFLNGRGLTLLTGYEELPESEKARINKDAMCRCMAKIMFALAGCWIVLMASAYFDSMALLGVFVFLLLGVIIAGAVIGSNHTRFYGP